jgi:hypothetical protein
MNMQWAGPPWRFHEAGFYRSDAEFAALIVPFAEDGVAAGQPVILGYDDRKASLLRSWLADPAAVTFLADASLYATPARAIDSYWRMFEELTAGGATQIRIAGDVPHEGNGGRFAGWDRYESAANTVWTGSRSGAGACTTPPPPLPASWTSPRGPTPASCCRQASTRPAAGTRRRPTSGRCRLIPIRWSDRPPPSR